MNNEILKDILLVVMFIIFMIFIHKVGHKNSCKYLDKDGKCTNKKEWRKCIRRVNNEKVN